MMHPTTPTAIAHGLTEAMAVADGCPNCVTNTETPRAAIPAGDHAWTVSYLCSDCGHAWLTNWRN